MLPASLALSAWFGSYDEQNGPTVEVQPLHLNHQVIARTRARLLRWGRGNYRQFAWRNEENAWLSFLAELLLQRTQAIQVAAIYPDICARFPTATSMVSAGAAGVRFLTDRLGLHWRGELVLKIAEVIAARGGDPPDDPTELVSMKGVGTYTAAAWLSLHRQQRAVIVDSNISRWLERMSGQPRLKDVRRDRSVYRTCASLTPVRAYRTYNYAVLDFTMTVCAPRKPQCHRCPVRSDCVYRAVTSVT